MAADSSDEILAIHNKMGSYHLFEATGIELEYMLVRSDDLSVLPKADELIKAACGAFESSVECGAMAWSNELVLHVIELKTKSPATSLDGIAHFALEDVRLLNRLLKPYAGCLMPTGMHPWMDPMKETLLWPHENQIVYNTFNRIFNCQGHGWSNLQSMHINLPFCGDDEFGRLHAAIRLILPILPALTASSPIMDGQGTGWLDNRLRVYRTNCALIPSITGHVIPEAVYNQAGYKEKILERIYADLQPYDPEGVLQEEWCNARGAIARFERNTIEIRVLDIQENPFADLAIAEGIINVLKALCGESWISYTQQQVASVEMLESIFMEVSQWGGDAKITAQEYLQLMGLKTRSSCTAAELWSHLFNQLRSYTLPQPIRVILEEGCLAKRIVDALGADPSKKSLFKTYERLCSCLENGEPFIP